MYGFRDFKQKFKAITSNTVPLSECHRGIRERAAQLRCILAGVHFFQTKNLIPACDRWRTSAIPKLGFVSSEKINIFTTMKKNFQRG